MAPRLPPHGEIHLWHVDLEGAMPDDAREVLDAVEWDRAARFRMARDRTRFARAHCALRSVLGGYLGMPAASLRFRVEAGGKPALAESGAPGFNLSHSGAHGLIAVGEAAHIGVDLEEMAPRADLDRLARSVFTPAEARVLDRADGADERVRRFHVGWTRKEAYLKALGIGLGLDPASVHVGLSTRRTRIAAARGDPAVDVAVVEQAPDRIAALAVVGGWTRVRHFRFGRC
jgi:4'-phosphopantetheinyl transferase